MMFRLFLYQALLIDFDRITFILRPICGVSRLAVKYISAVHALMGTR